MARVTRLAIAAVAALALSLLAPPPALGAWVWPLRGDVITHYRNGGDPYAAGQHRGIDIAGPAGAPVVAAAGGVVRFAGSAGYSGLTVGVRTADGRYDTSYLHLSSISVHEGARVAAGRRLGTVGTTGRRSAARPHLHFGVRDAGSRHAYHDPLDFLPPPARLRPAPRGTPTPVGAPARPSPAPLRHPAPVRVPRAAPRGVPSRAPRGAPGRTPLRLPTPRPLPAPAPRPAPTPHGAPAGGPEAGPASAPEPAARPAPAPGGRRGAPRVDGGPDLGWVLACLGLLMAAALMGTLIESRDGRARLGALLPGRVRKAWAR